MLFAQAFNNSIDKVSTLDLLPNGVPDGVTFNHSGILVWMVPFRQRVLQAKSGHVAKVLLRGPCGYHPLVKLRVDDVALVTNWERLVVELQVVEAKE
jgi:hypothetical protein